MSQGKTNRNGLFCLSFYCAAFTAAFFIFSGGKIEMNLIWFFAGIIIGSMIGVVLMCLLQINRHNTENKQQ